LLAVIAGILLPGRLAHAQAYPLKASANGRYLVDQKNRPFLLIGDAPQGLMVNLSEANADYYFANREARGFNALWINLLCAEYTGGRADASTIEGVKPFVKKDDLSTPNEAYFAHVDRILKLAAKHHLVALLDPAETGSFLSVMKANGVEKCRNYGRFLGARYKGFDNLVWMSGNDFQSWRNADDDAVVMAVAKGILDEDQRHLQTAELDYLKSSSSDDARWGSILSLNACYTYFPTYAETLKDYDRTPHLPVFLVEADYEFENGADPERLRRQEYWAMLSGATGQLYGNGYIWPIKSDWKDHLDTTGAMQMEHFKALFGSLAWHNLIPDQTHQIVTAGYGTFESGGDPHSSISRNDYATAASAPDGSLALVYLPTPREITVDLARLKGKIAARWFDPTDGTYASVSGSPFQNDGTRTFSPPGKNNAGEGDWVLVLESLTRRRSVDSRPRGSVRPPAPS
jgi:hypothetical protein